MHPRADAGVHACTPTTKKTTTPPKTGQTPSRTFNFWTKRCRRFPTAIVEIGSYDDESETLIYHTEKLAEAEPAITQVRNNLYAHA